MVVRIDGPANQSRRGRAIDETDRAVVLKQERVRHVADRGTERIGEAAHGQQELVLGGCEAHVVGLLLAPPKESTESRSELQQALVVAVGERGRRHRDTSYYDMVPPWPPSNRTHPKSASASCRWWSASGRTTCAGSSRNSTSSGR